MKSRSQDAQPGKRERLIASAARLIHENGIQATTLAMVAQAADVPLGNVYYYFKTREDLVRAVVDARLVEIHDHLARLEALESPQARLRALAHGWTMIAEDVVAFGCPVGTLTAELAKQGDTLRACAPGMLRHIVKWATAQFRELGSGDAAFQAESFIARIQGAALIANAFDDRALMTRHIRAIERSVDLASSNRARR